MTLTTRLTVFFLAALAVVLAGFSAGLYLLARHHLYRGADTQAAATLDALTAAVEFSDAGLEWEPQDRYADALRRDGAVRWGVFDAAGGQVDGSNSPADFWSAAPGGQPWLIARRDLTAEQQRPAKNADDGRRYDALTLAAAVPLGPVHDALRQLALTLAGLSAAAWLVTAVLGRWVCRRALAPVARMAGAVNLISSDRLGDRLPDPGTGDELADLGRAFNGLLGRLDDAFARQKRFTAEASHQLRTPLTGMLGQLEVALRRDRPPDDYRRALEAVRRQAEQLRDLTEMLLFLARADADARRPDTAVIDLGDWLRAFSVAVPGRESDVGLGTVADGVRARVQAPLLAQAVGNLVENACRYSDPGAPVRLHLEATAGEAVITVEDRGHGIDADDLPRVFEPFFRTADARNRGLAGTGLGLAVTARIVTALGGRVGAESRPGAGSRFWVAVPLAPADN